MYTTHTSTQQCLLEILGKWRTSAKSGKVFGAIPTVFSEAFDCLGQ